MSIERLTEEYRQILGMDLWKSAVAKIHERRLLASNACESKDDILEIKKGQGAIFELDLILGKKERPSLFERIIQEALDKSKKETNKVL
jgi:hypothetical protein